MRDTKPPRHPRSGRGLKDGLKDGARSARPERLTQYLPFGPAGEVLPEEGFEQQAAAREWLKHVEAGRIG